MYFMPASLAVRTHSSALNFTGLNSLAYCAVFGHGDLAAVHDPLADAGDLLAVVGAGGDGIDAPVDEHAEAGLAPPFHAGVALGGGLVGVGIGLDDLRRALDVERDDRGGLVRRGGGQADGDRVVGGGELAAAGGRRAGTRASGLLARPGMTSWPFAGQS